MMHRFVGILLLLVVCGRGAWGMAIAEPFTTLREALEPGGFWVGIVIPGSKVTLNGEPVWVADGGLTVVGFARDASLSQILESCDMGGCHRLPLTLVSRTYVTQKVAKVPKDKVDVSPADEKRIEADNRATQAARDAALQARDTEEPFVDEAMQLPVQGPTSGVFGSQRTYNGEERSWHKGHDLAVPVGTPIKAPAAGIVRLARNTFMSGNLVMLDHGAGITTVYAHLSRMDVRVGEKVDAGEVIGKAGTTGRSNGPHLHWGLYWQNVALDPILWVQTDQRPTTTRGD